MQTLRMEMRAMLSNVMWTYAVLRYPESQMHDW